MASGDDIDDKFRPVQAADVTDIAGLPRRVDLLAAEVRTGFELLNERLMPMLNRLESALDDLADRVRRVEREQVHAAKDRKDLSARLDALELSNTKRQRARKRK